MVHYHVDIIFGGDRLGKMLGRIHAAVLAAGAAKRYHHIGEAALYKLLYVREYQRLDVLKEHLYPTLFFKKLYHVGIQAVEFTVRLIAAGVGKGTAVKHKSAAVAAFVRRNALAEREAGDFDGKFAVLGNRGLLRRFLKEA